MSTSTGNWESEVADWAVGVLFFFYWRDAGWLGVATQQELTALLLRLLQSLVQPSYKYHMKCSSTHGKTESNDSLAGGCSSEHHPDVVAHLYSDRQRHQLLASNLL